MALRGMETFEIKRPVTPSTADKLPPSPNRDSFKWRSLSTDNLTDMAEKKIRRQNVLEWEPGSKRHNRNLEAASGQDKQSAEIVTPSNVQKQIFLPEDFDLEETNLGSEYAETRVAPGAPADDNFDELATTRQRKASLERRQKNLLAAISIEMNEKNMQENEDTDFDLDLPFELNKSYGVEASVADDVGSLRIRNFVSSPNEFNSENINNVGTRSKIPDVASTPVDNEVHFTIRNFATSPNEFTSSTQTFESGGFETIDHPDQSLSGKITSWKDDSDVGNTRARTEPFQSPPRALTRSLSEETRDVRQRSKPSPYKSGKLTHDSCRCHN